MDREKMSYLIGVVIVIVVLLLAGLLFFSLRNTSKEDKKQTETSQKKLHEYATTNAQVVYNADGAIRGGDEYQSIKISVDNSTRKLDIIHGYQSQPVASYSFGNTTEGFSQFLSALEVSGFTLHASNSKATDVAGQCPLGIRYIFSAEGIDTAKDALWTVSCTPRVGTFGGSLSTVQQLFQLQIPNYTTLTKGVDLN